MHKIFHPPLHALVDIVFPADSLGDSCDIVPFMHIYTMLLIHDLQVDAEDGRLLDSFFFCKLKFAAVGLIEEVLFVFVIAIFWLIQILRPVDTSRIAPILHIPQKLSLFLALPQPFDFFLSIFNVHPFSSTILPRMLSSLRFECAVL